LALAEKKFRSGLDSKPRSLLFELALAYVAMADNRMEDAEKDLVRTLAAAPEYGAAREALADVFADRGDWQQAFDSYRMAMRTLADDPRCKGRFAQVRRRLADERKAEA